MNKENLEDFKQGLLFLVEHNSELNTELITKIKSRRLLPVFWQNYLSIENYVDREVAKYYFDIHFGDYWWLFDKEWKFVDNTIEGLIKRIDILLNEGLPINWLNQLMQKCPLQYLNEDLPKK